MNSESVEQLLGRLYREGVRLTAYGNRLKCTGPAQIVAEAQSAVADRKAEIIAFLQAQPTGEPTTEITRLERPARIPLSFAQQRLWFLQEMQPGSPAYNIPFAIEIEGSLDFDAFKTSLNAIVSRHEVLRTNFVSVNGEPCQQISESKAVAIDEIDLRSQANGIEQVRAAAISSAKEPFDLRNDLLLRVAVYRVENTRWVVLFTIHHVVSDAWSTEILLRELDRHYRAALLGKSAELPALPVQYADFSIWQREWLKGEVLTEQLGYWQQQLQGELPTLQLPTDYPRKRVQTFAGAVEHFSISADTTSKLTRLTQEYSASLFMTLMAAFNLFLRRYSGQQDLLVGTPIANRHRREVEGMIGLFVNTLAIRTKLRPRETFTDVLKRVRQTTLDAYQHQDLPFEKLVEALQPDRDMSLSPLFQVRFRLENAPPEEVNLPGIKLRRLPQEWVSAKLDLAVDMYETPKGLVGGFEYNKDLFAPETVRRMVEHFVTLLDSIANRPNGRVGDLSVMGADETHRNLLEWNRREKAFAENACYHELFEAQVERTPDSVAVIFDPATAEADRIELSYKDLNRRANQLARHLVTAGVGPEDIVAICIDRSVEMTVALLAVLKSGGAYVPLDPNYPKSRLAFLLGDSNAKILLTTSDISIGDEDYDRQRNGGCERIDIDSIDLDGYSATNLPSRASSDNLAYLIYTSGSSGTPKAVLVPHRGLVNLTEDKIRVCDIQPGDCVLQFFSFSFDGSVPEFVMTLAGGATLLVAPSTVLLPGRQLRQLLIDNRVSHITMTPSALTALPTDEYPSLRMVLVGGEAPSEELIEQWSPGRKFINAYGPTETTVNASMVQCGNGHATEATILPSTNKQLYVLDDELELTPIGVVGELHIGGIGLARGYHQQSALTAERFIPNPFPPDANRKYNVPLLYKTGDLACYLPDGRIRIVGRVDQQTKIRGYRIEVGEIEHVLEKHPKVRAALVRVRKMPNGDQQLDSYGVPVGSDAMNESAIRDYLAEELPKFMLPSTFQWIEAIPLTKNGKLDVAALPLPQANQEAEKIKPRTEAEERLAVIFAEVLTVSEIGVEDNFFDLGGHSLMATRLVSMVWDTFQVEITVIDLFDAPSIAELARRIEQKSHLSHLVNVVVDDGDREEISL